MLEVAVTGANIASVFHVVFFLLIAGIGLLLVMLAVGVTSSPLDTAMDAILGVAIGVIGISMFCFGVQMVFPLN
mgnify:FL=1|jgi:hypothetical protein